MQPMKREEKEGREQRNEPLKKKPLKSKHGHYDTRTTPEKTMCATLAVYMMDFGV